MLDRILIQITIKNIFSSKLEYRFKLLCKINKDISKNYA